nr:hypothetical protein [Lachnospiraceae bacterium]
MKKLLSLILVLALVVSMCACAKKNDAPADKGEDSEIQIGADTPTPEPTKAEQPQSTPAEAAADITEEPAKPAEYVRADDEDIYEQVLGGYAEYSQKAKAADSIDKRFLYFAQAEAYLLDSAVMIPTTTQGGAYTISRVAPRTVPYVQWGNDDDRLKGMIISDDFCTPEERADMLAEWSKAVAGEGVYDPAAYLTSKGHTLKT